MKKSFMTRVLAVTLSAAMTFSLSSINMMTASAAAVSLTKTKLSMTVGDKATKLKLKNNSLNWKIKSASSTKKKVCKIKSYTAKYVQLKAKSEGKATIKVKVKTSQKKKNNTKLLKCKVTVNAQQSVDPGPGQDTPATPTELNVTARATSQSVVEVTFDKTLDNELTKENISIEGVDVIDVTTTDRRTFTVNLAGTAASTKYNMTIKGIQIDAKEVEDQTVEFTTPASAIEGYKLELTATGLTNGVYMKADGASQASLECKITGPDGNLVTDDGIVVEFATDRGSLGSTRVTAEGGVAKNTFRSESLTSNVAATITATVKELSIATSNARPELMGQTTSLNITMTPTPEDYVDGNTITSAESDQADRVIAYFANDVNIDSYKQANGSIDTSKVDISVQDGLNNAGGNGSNGRTQTAARGGVVDLLPVASNPKAMQILVDQPLTDNSNISVTFTDKTGKVQTRNTVYFKLTDARQPELIRVTNNGYRQLELEFSEAVIPDSKNINNKMYSADRLTNYRIDGIALNNTRYGDPSSNNSATVTVGTAGGGVDNRHIVTITFGKNANGKRFYLEPGEHSVQVSNVGDWAVNSDIKNYIETQTLNFTVTPNDTRPAIESVDVQSPEQMLITFNTDVEFNADYSDTDYPDVNGIEDLHNDGEHTVIRLEQQVGNRWIDLSKDNTSAYKNPIRVTSVAENKYLVEVTNDWTQVYRKNTSQLNYFNFHYRFRIAAEALENINNGLINTTEITHELDQYTTMTQPDEGQVEIKAIEIGDAAESTYIATLSEPIKLARANGGTDGINDEGLTPSQDQVNEAGVPVPTAEFIKLNGTSSVSVQAKIKGFDTDSEDGLCDKALVIIPERELDGGEWRLYLRSVSDDYGNTAPTLAKTFEVDAPTATNFEVAWAAVADADHYDHIISDVQNGIAISNVGHSATADIEGASSISSHSADAKGRYIFVKFTDAVKVFGTTDNALSQLNYVLNGKSLPQGAYVKAGIVGCDASSLDNGADIYAVTIVLPKNEEVDGRNSVLNISNTITSKRGETLNPDGTSSIAGTYEYKLSYRIAELYNNRDADAVWGNAPSEERWTGSNQPADYAATTNAGYFAAVQSALNNNQYREVRLSDTLEIPEGRTLRITRPVELNLNGHDIIGNVSIAFNDGTKCEIVSKSKTWSGTYPSSLSLNSSETKNSTGYARIIGTVTVNTPYADWTNGESVDISGDLLLEAIPDNTFTNNGKINTISVTGSKCRIVNGESGTIKGITISTTNDVKIENNNEDAPIENVNAERKVKVSLSGKGSVETFTAKAAGVTLQVANKDNVTKIVKEVSDFTPMIGDTVSKELEDLVEVTGNAAFTVIAEKIQSAVTVTQAGVVQYYGEHITDANSNNVKVEDYQVEITSDNTSLIASAAEGVGNDAEWNGTWPELTANSFTETKTVVLTVTITEKKNPSNKTTKKVTVTLMKPDTSSNS